MVDLPVIQRWERARLPALYERARQILVECESVDECKRWVAQAEAIASYYRQAKDQTLIDLAHRIRLRAQRRLGELLKQADLEIVIDADLPNGGHAKMAGTLLAEANNIGRREASDLRKLAAMAEAEFERIVEGPAPPTLAAVRASTTYRRVEKTGPDRLASHLRALAFLFRRYPPETFRPTGDLEFVKECLARIG